MATAGGSAWSGALIKGGSLRLYDSLLDSLLWPKQGKPGQNRANLLKILVFLGSWGEPKKKFHENPTVRGKRHSGPCWLHSSTQGWKPRWSIQASSKRSPARFQRRLQVLGIKHYTTFGANNPFFPEVYANDGSNQITQKFPLETPSLQLPIPAVARGDGQLRPELPFSTKLKVLNQFQHPQFAKDYGQLPPPRLYRYHFKKNWGEPGVHPLRCASQQLDNLSSLDTSQISCTLYLYIYIYMIHTCNHIHILQTLDKIGSFKWSIRNWVLKRADWKH